MNFNNGEIINTFFQIIDKFLLELSTDNKDFQIIIDQFTKSYKEILFVTNHLKLSENDAVNGSAVEFLRMFSYISLGYIWLKMLNISIKKRKIQKSNFLNSKIATGKYYFNKILPKTTFLKDHILSGDSYYNDYKDDFFESGFIL